MSDSVGTKCIRVYCLVSFRFPFAECLITYYYALVHDNVLWWIANRLCMRSLHMSSSDNFKLNDWANIMTNAICAYRHRRITLKWSRHYLRFLVLFRSSCGLYKIYNANSWCGVSITAKLLALAKFNFTVCLHVTSPLNTNDLHCTHILIFPHRCYNLSAVATESASFCVNAIFYFTACLRPLTRA